MKKEISIRLWNINRWLRYTGFRFFVMWEDDTKEWTRIGIKFYGWKNL